MRYAEFGPWIDVCDVGSIPPLGARVVRAPLGDIAVFRSANDTYFALRDRCPHKGGVLSQGIVHGERVTCPLHNWVIDLQTGDALAPDVGCAPKFPVEVRNGRIWLSLVSEQAEKVGEMC